MLFKSFMCLIPTDCDKLNHNFLDLRNLIFYTNSCLHMFPDFLNIQNNDINNIHNKIYI